MVRGRMTGFVIDAEYFATCCELVESEMRKYRSGTPVSSRDLRAASKRISEMPNWVLGAALKTVADIHPDSDPERDHYTLWTPRGTDDS